MFFKIAQSTNDGDKFFWLNINHDFNQ